MPLLRPQNYRRIFHGWIREQSSNDSKPSFFNQVAKIAEDEMFTLTNTLFSGHADE